MSDNDSKTCGVAVVALIIAIAAAVFVIALMTMGVPSQPDSRIESIEEHLGLKWRTGGDGRHEKVNTLAKDKP